MGKSEPLIFTFRQGKRTAIGSGSGFLFFLIGDSCVVSEYAGMGRNCLRRGLDKSMDLDRRLQPICNKN